MIVRLFEEKDKEKWNNFITDIKSKENKNFVTVYSTINWKNVLEKTFGYQSFYLIAEDGNHICGVFPLMYIKSLIFGKRLMSLPFTDYGCGPIVLNDDKNVLNLLLEKSDEIAKDLGVEYLRIHPSSKKQIEQLGSFGFKKGRPYHGFIFNIEGSNEDMWNKKFTRDSKIRNTVRKAEKSGIVVKTIKEEQQMDDLYSVYLKSIKLLGTPPYKKDFFLNIFREFKEKGSNFFFAEINKKMIAIAVNIPFCKSIYVSAGGMSLKEYKNLNPLTLVYWESIKKANDLGFKEYDFGGSRLDSSQQKFKEHWSTSMIETDPLYRYYSKKHTELDPRNKKFEFLSYVWSKFVPVFITKTIGPYIRKGLGI